jgi:rod shape-determining protein MreD
MSGRRVSLSQGERFGKRINRAPSPLLARIVPWATIMLGSLVPAWLVIASAPLLPPLGYLMLLSWRQLRPGLLPVWAGLPLGVFDDLYSGQPMGNAVFLWSLSVIALDIVEERLPWRNFFIEWLVAAGLIAGYIWLGVATANLAGASTPFYVVVPQILLSITIYPLIGRLVASLDRLRLKPIRNIGG